MNKFRKGDKVCYSGGGYLKIPATVSNIVKTCNDRILYHILIDGNNGRAKHEYAREDQLIELSVPSSSE